MRRFIVVSLAVATLIFPVLSWGATWEIDPAHTHVQFAVRHLVVSTVRGDFGKVSGTVTFDEKDPTSMAIDATIDTASLNTRVAKRDEHLRGPDFFDVAKYPTMTFKSKKVIREGDEKFKIIGDLTLRGVTREVALDLESSAKPIQDQFGRMRVGGTATTKINRGDFGMTWSKTLETGGVVVGDEVAITIDIEMTQPAATTTAVTNATPNVAGGTRSDLGKKTVGAAAGE